MPKSKWSDLKYLSRSTNDARACIDRMYRVQKRDRTPEVVADHKAKFLRKLRQLVSLVEQFDAAS